MATLLLVRHGQSAWNLENRFTGWWDVDLSDQGEQEAHQAGRLLAEEGLLPDVAYTSVLTRAIRTLNILQEEMGRLWVPVYRHWRLNERHYGGLTGLDKAETRERYGNEQFMLWRRSYDVPPPPLEAGSSYDVSADPRYVPGVVPKTECLADVVVRLLPYWYDAIAPDLLAGKVVLVAAHGNSLRALIKHLDQMDGETVSKLEIPTGVPIVYELDKGLRPLQAGGRWLGDPEAIAAATEAVRRQGQRA
ncbi:MAG: phosphoglyceromutase [Actinobacteria bacterium]|nr:phosphoglyceromutase [Actinomycetota bacterium]